MIKKYPKHFYEPIRLEIAVEQIQHDFRKLFPTLDEKTFNIIDQDIANWHRGDDYELEPIHDFWNFFGGFTRELKFKSLLYWITADNVTWVKEAVKIDDILITWDFPGLEFMGKAPFSAAAVRKELGKPSMRQKKESMKAKAKWRSERFPPRDQFRVILFHDKTGGVIDKPPGFYILEGNRRVTRAMLFGEKAIPSYVGRFANQTDHWPEKYWTRTGILPDLVFLSIYYNKEKDLKAFRVVRKFYQLLLRDSDLARFVTINRTFKQSEKSDRLLMELLKEDLMSGNE